MDIVYEPYNTIWGKFLDKENLQREEILKTNHTLGRTTYQSGPRTRHREESERLGSASTLRSLPDLHHHTAGFSKPNTPGSCTSTQLQRQRQPSRSHSMSGISELSHNGHRHLQSPSKIQKHGETRLNNLPNSYYKAVHSGSYGIAVQVALNDLAATGNSTCPRCNAPMRAKSHQSQSKTGHSYA